jgi:hypothetical protein
MLLIYVALLFIRPQEWLGFMRGWPVMDVVVGAAILTWAMSLRENRWRPREAPQNWLMVGLLVAVLMSHVRHTYFAGFRAALTSFGKTVVIYMLVVSLLDSTRRIRAFLGVVAVGAMVMALHVWLQVRFGQGFGGQTLVKHFSVYRVRYFGVFNDPNDLALVFVAAAPFFFRMLVRTGAGCGSRALGLGMLALAIYALVRTESRGGWLAFAMMAASYVALNIESKAGRNAAILLALAMLAGALWLAPGRMGQFDTTDASSRGRWAAWGEGAAMLKQSPLFGVGEKRFTEYSDDSLVAHNSFVHCYAELGLFGYFFWLALIMASLQDGYAIIRTGRGGREPGDEAGEGQPPAMCAREAGSLADGAGEVAACREIACAAVPGLIGFLSAAFFLSRTYVIPLYVFFGLFAALRQILQRAGWSSPFLWQWRHWKLVLAAEFASIGFIYIATRVLM